MARYASGKKAWGYSDRSGFRYRLRDMIKEWNGSTVHISEFERKHPQLEPLPIISDPEALDNARPQRADSRCFVGLIGVNTNIFSSVGMQPKKDAKETKLLSQTGNVTVSTS